MKKFLKFLICGLCFSSTVMADDVQATSIVNLWTANGASYRFKCATQPKVVPDGGEWLITADGVPDLRVSQQDILKFTFSADETAIKAVTEDPSFSITSKSLKIDNLKQGEQVAIYTLDGKAVVNQKAEGKGLTDIDINTLPKGVYVVKSQSITFKFQKR